MAGANYKNLKLPFPAKYSGTTKENFDEWENKFRNYRALCENNHSDEMLWASQQTTEITKGDLAQFDDDLSVDECWGRSLALYYILTSYLEGTAYLIVDQLDDCNGYEAWRRLAHRFLRSKTQSGLTTLISIANTKFPEDNIEAVLSKWEKDITQFERAIQKPLYEEIKTGLLIGGTNGKLHDHLCLTCTELDDYDEVRAAVINYAKTKTLKIPTSGGGSKKDYGYDPMDIGNVQNKNYEGKGGWWKKGKDKGKKG